jgi:uncharacterized coiled-coil protein SlyX
MANETQTQQEAGRRDPAGTSAPDYAKLIEELHERLAEQSRKMEGLSATVKDRDEKLAQERQLSALRLAIAKVDWFDPEDAVRELSAQVREKDGRFFVCGEGGQTSELDEAVAALARRKAHWVRARPAGGSGAAGATGPQFSEGARVATRRDLRAGLVDPADIVAGKVRIVD